MSDHAVPVQPDPNTGTRERLLFRLKTRGPMTASDLAQREQLSSAAVRQHLAQLEADGLISGSSPSETAGVGRPALRWALTGQAEQRFPESYAELALQLIGGVREAFGAKGLDRLTAARTKVQLATYREHMPAPSSDLSRRVAALTRLRNREGYMAEWRRSRDGTITLIENHCPVCAAAQICRGICDGELELFATLLPDAEVERTEHMLEGARRCAYRITPR